MTILIGVAVTMLLLFLSCMLGAMGAFALDMWDRFAERREQRRIRREKLREALR